MRSWSKWRALASVTPTSSAATSTFLFLCPVSSVTKAQVKWSVSGQT